MEPSDSLTSVPFLYSLSTSPSSLPSVQPALKKPSTSPSTNPTSTLVPIISPCSAAEPISKPSLNPASDPLLLIQLYDCHWFQQLYSHQENHLNAFSDAFIMPVTRAIIIAKCITFFKTYYCNAFICSIISTFHNETGVHASDGVTFLTSPMRSET